VVRQRVELEDRSIERVQRALAREPRAQAVVRGDRKAQEVERALHAVSAEAGGRPRQDARDVRGIEQERAVARREEQRVRRAHEHVERHPLQEQPLLAEARVAQVVEVAREEERVRGVGHAGLRILDDQVVRFGRALEVVDSIVIHDANSRVVEP
jgi:hypothetical protein